MKELQDIAFTAPVDGQSPVGDHRQAMALATVIEVRGSTYRRPGARMLVTLAGQTGSISGGCLEADVCEHARQVILSAKPMQVQYDTSLDDLWGVGQGCKGFVRVFIEPLLPTDCNPIAFINRCRDRQQPGVLATVIAAQEQPAGTHLTLCEGEIASDINCLLFDAVLADARRVLASQQSRLKRYTLPIAAEVLIESIQPPIPIVIFGAGDDAIPVAQFAKALGWHVMVVDHRPAYANSIRFPTVDAIVLARSDQIAEQCFSPRTVAVIMTHHYEHDREILKTLLPLPLAYLGILGAKSKTAQMLQDFQEAEIRFSKAQLQQLHSPIGLDIGADTPLEIALAIVAEIRAVLANRSGGKLCDRQAPIH